MISPSAPAIRVTGLGKSYRIKHQQHDHSTAVEAALHRLRHPLRRPEVETFWALRGLDFEVQRGDVVGIIGRNGAGKSTLLKVLSRITEPTAGRVELRGRVGSLLEVGTGFHPELSGRENIYLNGSILGMRRREIDRQFDAIVDFAGVEKFLDTPVKRYSSGMYVRLAFAVAAHLDLEIMVVDEVLAVGDAEFQKKCLGKMKDVAHSGRTVLFVSHHMQSVQVLCDRAMYLEHGRCTYLGDVPGAIEKYTQSFERSAGEACPPQRRGGSGEFRFTHVSPTRQTFDCGEAKTLRYRFERQKPYEGRVFLSCHLVDELGVIVAQCDSRMVGHWLDADDAHEGTLTIRTPWLKPGSYRVDLTICSAGVMDRFEHACDLQVIPLLPYPAAGNTEATARGLVFADFDYTTDAAPPEAAPPEASPSEASPPADNPGALEPAR
ncbi:MAG: ABC transporter ATP-binding protein [Planctomycetota bacterium]